MGYIGKYTLLGFLCQSSLDVGTRAFVIAAYSDFFPCIYGPSILLYAAPVFREKMTSYVSKLKGTVANCCEMLN